MSRLIVMPDQESAAGFELTGVDVIRTPDAATARDRLLDLLNDSNVGMIAVSESILQQLDASTRRRVDETIKPVVVGLPTGGPAGGATDRRAYLSALLRRAVGFDLEFGGEPKT